MANTSQARKRARQNIKRRARNMSARSALRTAIKKLLKLGKEQSAAADDAYREATSRIDRATGKGLHHANRAARLKKRLNRRLRALKETAVAE